MFWPYLPFDEQIKREAKKYPSLKFELSELLHSLEINPKQGIPLGNDCYKIRMAIVSKGKGKSGRARIITCFRVVQSSVYLLSIYDKTGKDDISNRELYTLLKFIP